MDHSDTRAAFDRLLPTSHTVSPQPKQWPAFAREPSTHSSLWQKSRERLEFAGLENRIALRCFYGDGHSQTPAAAGVALGDSLRAGHGTRTSFLQATERTPGPREVRRVRREGVRPVLCRQQ